MLLVSVASSRQILYIWSNFLSQVSAAKTLSEFTIMINRKSTTAINERLSDYVDLDRYPIHELDGDTGQALIAQALEMMDSDTICLLDGFLREPAVSALSSEITLAGI